MTRYRLFKDGDYFLLEKHPPDFMTLGPVMIAGSPVQGASIKDVTRAVKSAGAELHGKKFAIVKFCLEIECVVTTKSVVQFSEAERIPIAKDPVDDKTAPLPFPDAGAAPKPAAKPAAKVTA